jgi:DNA-binding transcriptional MerR regulator
VTWSTRELADLAGTTINTVRHYHALGLLDAPERKYNGYKQYRVAHLVRLIHVRRLVELGAPLAQVGPLGEEGVALPSELLQLDAQVEAEIERLRRARSDIAAILRSSAPAATPHGFEFVASQLSLADRSLIQVYARLHDEMSVAGLREMIAREPGPIRREFAALASETSEPVRQRLAERIAALGANWRSAERVWSGDELRRRRVNHRPAIDEVLRDLYDPAQLDVISRADHAARGEEPQRTAIALSA